MKTSFCLLLFSSFFLKLNAQTASVSSRLQGLWIQTCLDKNGVASPPLAWGAMYRLRFTSDSCSWMSEDQCSGFRSELPALWKYDEGSNRIRFTWVKPDSKSKEYEITRLDSVTLVLRCTDPLQSDVYGQVFYHWNPGQSRHK